MKIEKISENQIRCTLSKEDLLDRELRLSELAYGTEKAKALFQDMIQQASYEFGFEAENIPLMIEAIPVSADSLVLVITKVEDPDELDTRFSKFSQELDDNEFTIDDDDTAYADEVLNCFDQLNELIDGAGDTLTEDDDAIDFIPLPEAIAGKNRKKNKDNDIKPISTQTNLTKVFTFHSLEEVIVLAEHIVHIYTGVNTLYKDPIHKTYYLVVNKSEHTPEEFNKICNIISEYGKSERSTYATCSYYEEHFERILKDCAVQVLCTM